MCDTIKKIIKIVGIIAAIVGVAAGIYMIVKKVLDKKSNPLEDDACDYISCSCFDDEEDAAQE